MRVLVAGASTQEICGVRDCAETLDAPLRDAGVETVTVWTDDPRRLPGAVAVAGVGADAIIWHYSPFTYAWRGLPLHVPAVARGLQKFGVPVVGFLHELAPDFGRGGWKSDVQAATQRAALVPLLRALAGAIVTSEERLTRLRRAWLPRRPLAFVPLTSHVAPVPSRNGYANGELRIGVFGFRHSTLAVDLVARSVGELGDGARLVLVGAPGAEGPAATAWREAAARHGARLEFTGVLPLPGLSHVLSSLDLVLSPDPAGPAPRRSTLAAALAHSRPVLALDGPLGWEALPHSGAVVVADEADFPVRLAQLVSDPELRRVQGLRARAFYQRWLAPDVVAARIRDFVAQVIS